MNVIFKHGTYAQYQALVAQGQTDSGTLYFITDRGLIYKGTVLVTDKIVIANVPASNNTPAHVAITDKSTPTPTVFELYNRSQVDAAIATAIAANDAMVFKGTLGTNGTVHDLPDSNYKVGWTFRVVTSGTYAGKVCEVGDLVICVGTRQNPTNDDWTVAQTNIDGAVVAARALTNGGLVVGYGENGHEVETIPAGMAGDILTQGSNGSPVWTTPNFAPSTHNHSASEITSGTLPVSRGGTGKNTLASGQVLVGKGTSAVGTKPIDTTVTEDSENLVTSGAVYSAIADAQASATIEWIELA